MEIVLAGLFNSSDKPIGVAVWREGRCVKYSENISNIVMGNTDLQSVLPKLRQVKGVHTVCVTYTVVQESECSYDGA